MQSHPISRLAALLSLIVMVALTASALGAHPPTPWSGRVVGVTDGDTLKVMERGQAIKVRVAEIDTPERRQPFSTKAKQFTSALCFNRVVTVLPQAVDRYGRVVARIRLVDGRDLSEELVRAGMAWHYRRYSSDSHLAVLEEEARAANRGLWSDSKPIAPWEWRRGRKK